MTSFLPLAPALPAEPQVDVLDTNVDILDTKVDVLKADPIDSNLVTEVSEIEFPSEPVSSNEGSPQLASVVVEEPIPEETVPAIDLSVAAEAEKPTETELPKESDPPAVVPEGAATRLKRMVEETDELIVCPGVYDGFSARIAMEVGFSALYMTGAGTTASRLGQPDLGIAQLSDMSEHAEMIANLDPYGSPLIADMDVGWGGPIMVDRSVATYIRAGVAGFHIEDQIQNKRCGHLAGKRVVSREEYYVRIRAAVAAKRRLHSDIVLIARTDANQMHGYEECIARLKVARELGADVGLLEGFKSKEEARAAVKELAPWPLLLNSVENGASPLITVDEAREMGFRIMIFSFAALAPAYVAIKTTFERLKAEGVVGTSKNLSPRKLFEVCGLNQSMEIDTSAGNDGFALGV